MEVEGLRIRFLAGHPALATDLSTLFRALEQTSGNAIGAISRLPTSPAPNYFCTPMHDPTRIANDADVSKIARASSRARSARIGWC